MFIYFLSLGEGAGAGHVRVLLIGEVQRYKVIQTSAPNSSQKLCRHDFKPMWQT